MPEHGFAACRTDGNQDGNESLALRCFGRPMNGNPSSGMAPSINIFCGDGEVSLAHEDKICEWVGVLLGKIRVALCFCFHPVSSWWRPSMLLRVMKQRPDADAIAPE